MDEKGFVSTLIDLVENTQDTYSLVSGFCSDVGDSIGPIKAFKSFIDFSLEQRLKIFLQSFYCKYRVDILDDKSKEQLREYIKKPKNLNFIADTINSAINSRSINCSAILGLYTGQLLVKLEEIKNVDYIIIFALKNMLDHDIENFIKIYESLFEEKFEKTYRLCDQKDILGEDVFELELTLEKLKNNQVLGYDIGGGGNSGNAWGMFVFNKNSKYFYELIKNLSIH